MITYNSENNDVLIKVACMRSRRFSAGGRRQGVVEETPAQLAMTNVFSPIKGGWRFVIGSFTGSAIIQL